MYIAQLTEIPCYVVNTVTPLYNLPGMVHLILYSIFLKTDVSVLCKKRKQALMAFLSRKSSIVFL